MILPRPMDAQVDQGTVVVRVTADGRPVDDATVASDTTRATRTFTTISIGSTTVRTTG